MLAINILSVHHHDPEAGSAVALFLAAAGYEVETDFYDGSAFVMAEAVDPEIALRDVNLNDLARQLRAQLDNPVDEIELAELRSEFRIVA